VPLRGTTAVDREAAKPACVAAKTESVVIVQQPRALGLLLGVVADEYNQCMAVIHPTKPIDQLRL
jgi:hypothetical protein